MGRVHTHLVEVLLMSSLSLRPFSVKVDTILDKGFLRDRSLLLPHGEGFHPPGQLPPCARSCSCSSSTLTDASVVE
jgi:hypothetical protein